jgi:hypothetical protein
VSVLSKDDSLNTVMLAIMAVALRVAKVHSGATSTSGISPTAPSVGAPIAPLSPSPRAKHCKTQ